MESTHLMLVPYDQSCQRIIAQDVWLPDSRRYVQIQQTASEPYYITLVEGVIYVNLGVANSAICLPRSNEPALDSGEVALLAEFRLLPEFRKYSKRFFNPCFEILAVSYHPCEHPGSPMDI